jgi:hypothetical protein
VSRVAPAAALALAALALPCSVPVAARAEPAPGLPASVARGLDGEEYFAGEPIWLCADPQGSPTRIPGWFTHNIELIGTDAAGHAVRRGYDVRVPLTTTTGPATPTPGDPPPRGTRGGEFGQTFGFDDPSGQMPLVTFKSAIPVGAWELHPATGDDTSRVLARFRVVEPRGVERAVHDGLARAARLAPAGDSGAEQAARLYAAILARYPRTAYLTVVYAGLWRVRAHTRFGADPDRWLEEIFARFHDTCFGTIALDQWVGDMGEVRARTTVRRLVGLYPDTPLSRAAARYL